MKIKIHMVAIITACMLSACGGGDPDPAPTQVERVSVLLQADGHSWAPAASTGVTVDGVDVTEDLFSGFSITFHERTFTTTGTTPVWLREDTWTFKDETAKVMIRGQDNKEITITEVSDTQLKLTLEWTQTTHSGGRQGSLKGKHEFLLTR